MIQYKKLRRRETVSLRKQRRIANEWLTENYSPIAQSFNLKLKNRYYNSNPVNQPSLIEMA